MRATASASFATSTGGAPRKPLQQLRAAQLGHHLFHVGWRHGQEAQAHVLQRLDPHAAQSERDDGAPLGVDAHAREELDAALCAWAKRSRRRAVPSASRRRPRP